MQTTKPAFVEIYTESTPNPKMLKFVASHIFLPNMMLDCKTKEDAKESPLAQMLYEFEFVDTVFISNNFVTIGKKENISEEWFELSFDVKEALKHYLKEAKPIVTNNFIQDLAQKKEAAKVENETDQKIIDLLEKYVKPAVEMDGGHIAFKSFEDGVVSLSLQGACSGCPSSSVTLKDGIEAMLKRMLPDVKEVVAYAE